MLGNFWESFWGCFDLIWLGFLLKLLSSGYGVEAEQALVKWNEKKMSSTY